MKTYEEIVRGYRRRRKDTVVDTVATGISYVDNIAADYVLPGTETLPAVVSASLNALPFAVIAVVEGTKVLLGRKPARTGTKDAVRRMVKTGVALGIGSAAAGLVGPWAAAPAAVGMRYALDRKKSRYLGNLRVRSRIARLQEMRRHMERETVREEEETEPGAVRVDGTVR